MNIWGRLVVLGAVCAATAAGQQEALRYSINWPSGLSLGEAMLTSNLSNGAGGATLTLEAVVPGYPIRDEYKSTMAGGYCSANFRKESTHGKRHALETMTFDTTTNTVRRETDNGGKTETPLAGPCPKDALAFLMFLRQELKQGRLPGPQTIYFGSTYALRLQFAGSETVVVNEQRTAVDKLSAVVKGPASEVSFDIYFAQDSARTPVLVRVPLAMGSFSMELVRE